REQPPPEVVCRVSQTSRARLQILSCLGAGSGWAGGASRPRLLVAVGLLQICGNFGFQFGVAGMNGGAESSFGGGTLADALKNALHVAHAVGIANVLNRRQRLVIGKERLVVCKTNPGAVERVEWKLMLAGIKLCQPAAVPGRRAWLDDLGDAFVQPLRAAAARDLVDKGMSELVLEHPGKLGRDGGEAVDRNSELAIVHSGAPSRGLCDIEESLIGVERDGNVLAGCDAQVADQGVVVSF